MSDEVRIRYVGPHREVEVEAHDGSAHFVEQGEVKEFSPDVAASLLEQPANWRPASQKISDEADERAVELGVNVNEVEGTGSKGAIKVSDVEKAAAEAAAALDDAGEEPDPPAEDSGEDEEE